MKKCYGLKFAKKCKSNVYKCSNCGAIGYDQYACDKQNFQSMECMKCKRSHGNEPVY
jgi:hypothetical protein